MAGITADGFLEEWRLVVPKVPCSLAVQQLRWLPHLSEILSVNFMIRFNLQKWPSDCLSWLMQFILCLPWMRNATATVLFCQGFHPSIELLRGHVLLTGAGQAAGIVPFSVESLPKEPVARFRALFAARPEWNIDDLKPYLDGLQVGCSALLACPVCMGNSSCRC